LSKSCYNCGTENADVEKFCRNCGAALGHLADMQQSGIQAGRPEERVLWENADIQLTTEAVLIGMDTDAPEVVPLDSIYEVALDDERCLVLRVKDGADKHCMLDEPQELAALINEQMMRPRLAQSRKEHGYIPPD